jgi:hypothetical protein
MTKRIFLAFMRQGVIKRAARSVYTGTTDVLSPSLGPFDGAIRR